MAELLVKVGDNGPADTDWKDGDIVSAISRRQIRHQWAHHICFTLNLGQFNADALRARGTLLEDWMAQRERYRMERVSQSEVTCTDLSARSMRQITIAGLDQHIRNLMTIPVFDEKTKRTTRISHPHHTVFGEVGREVWYTSKWHAAEKAVRPADDMAAMDAIWAKIEAKSDYREANHTAFQWGRKTPYDMLVLGVEDLDDAAAGALTKPVEIEVEEDGRRVTKVEKPTSSRVDYRSFLSGDTLDSVVRHDLPAKDVRKFKNRVVDLVVAR